MSQEPFELPNWYRDRDRDPGYPPSVLRTWMASQGDETPQPTAKTPFANNPWFLEYIHSDINAPDIREKLLGEHLEDESVAEQLVRNSATSFEWTGKKIWGFIKAATFKADEGVYALGDLLNKPYEGTEWDSALVVIAKNIDAVIEATSIGTEPGDDPTPVQDVVGWAENNPIIQRILIYGGLLSIGRSRLKGNPTKAKPKSRGPSIPKRIGTGLVVTGALTVAKATPSFNDLRDWVEDAWNRFMQGREELEAEDLDLGEMTEVDELLGLIDEVDLIDIHGLVTDTMVPHFRANPTLSLKGQALTIEQRLRRLESYHD